MQRQRSFGSGRPRSPCHDNVSAPQKLTAALADSLVEHTNAIIRMNNLGISHMESSSFEDAIALFRRALDQAEQAPADHHLPGNNSSGSSPIFVATSAAPDMNVSPLKPAPLASIDKRGGSFVKAPNPLPADAHITNNEQEAPHDGQQIMQYQLQANHQHQEHHQFQPKEYYIYQRREYDEGMSMYYSPIRMDASSMDNASDPKSAASTILCYNLGQAYMRLEKDEEAKQWFERALHSPRGYLHMTVHAAAVSPFKILHNLGYIQYRRQDIQCATQTFREALQESQKSVNKLDVANSLNALGVLFFHLPEPDAAQSMDCYNQALTIRKALLGPTHVDVATCLNNIGRVHYIEQRYDDALLVYQEALRIRRLLLGQDHLDVAATGK